jgi:hypothetical protein
MGSKPGGGPGCPARRPRPAGPETTAHEEPAAPGTNGGSPDAAQALDELTEGFAALLEVLELVEARARR